MPLDTIKAIHTRYSCRAFSDKMPSDEDLQTIAKAAVAAPSGLNRQPWRVIVIKNKELLADLEDEGMKNLAESGGDAYERIMTRGGRLYYGAPCMVVVPILDGTALDCGIICENIALAAASLGLDSLICGLAAFSFAGTRGEELKMRMDFPDGYKLGITVLLGSAENSGGTPHEPDTSKITWIE